jgi:hypothetical protein
MNKIKRDTGNDLNFKKKVIKPLDKLSRGVCKLRCAHHKKKPVAWLEKKKDATA